MNKKKFSRTKSMSLRRVIFKKLKKIWQILEYRRDYLSARHLLLAYDAQSIIYTYGT